MVLGHLDVLRVSVTRSHFEGGDLAVLRGSTLMRVLTPLVLLVLQGMAVLERLEEEVWSLVQLALR